MEAQEVDALRSSGIRIVTLMRNLNATRKYPDALPSLLKTMNEETSTRFDTDPLFISELTDERLMENPILYVNCDDQPNLEFPAEELAALRHGAGGFVIWMRESRLFRRDLGHSYAAWEERPEGMSSSDRSIRKNPSYPYRVTMRFSEVFIRACPRTGI